MGVSHGSLPARKLRNKMAMVCSHGRNIGTHATDIAHRQHIPMPHLNIDSQSLTSIFPCNHSSFCVYWCFILENRWTLCISDFNGYLYSLKFFHGFLQCYICAFSDYWVMPCNYKSRITSICLQSDICMLYSQFLFVGCRSMNLDKGLGITEIKLSVVIFYYLWIKTLMVDMAPKLAIIFSPSIRISSLWAVLCGWTIPGCASHVLLTSYWCQHGSW